MKSSASFTDNGDDKSVVSITFADGEAISGDISSVISTIGVNHALVLKLMDAKIDATEPKDIAALQDIPYWHGDDPCDCLQGILHVAQNARYLLTGGCYDGPTTHVPAIAIGAGPSLSLHLDDLRKLQHHCLLVASDMTLDPLMKAGITPHIVTPVERMDCISLGLKASAYPDTVFAGSPVVLADVASRFERRLFVGGADKLYDWINPRCRLPYGSSTGVMAASIASGMTTGMVYLVGHDLGFANGKSHWDEHDNVPEVANQELRIAANGGGSVQTIPFWNRLKNELTGIARSTGRIVNINAHHGRGAVIPGTISGPLPSAEGALAWGVPAPRLDILESWAAKAKALPDDAHHILAKLDGITDIRQTEMRDLCPTGNTTVFSYLLRSVYAQLSIECKLGRGAHVPKWFASAARNVLEGSMDTFKEVAHVSA